jgi:hypothetical protein
MKAEFGDRQGRSSDGMPALVQRQIGVTGDDHPPIADPSPTERASFFRIGLGKGAQLAKSRCLCARLDRHKVRQTRNLGL